MKKIDLSKLEMNELEEISAKLSAQVESELDKVRAKLDKKLKKYGLRIELSCKIELENENQGGLDG